MSQLYKILVLHLFYFHFICFTIKGKAWTGPEGSRRLRLSEFLDNQHMKVVRLSKLCTGRLHP